MRKDFFSVEDMEQISRSIEAFIDKYVKLFNKDGIVIGVSGGIDSAVLAYLAVEALGKERVTLVHITERDTLKESTKCARKVAEKLGIHLKKKDITLALDAFGVYYLQPLMGYIVPERLKIEYAKRRAILLEKNGGLFLKHLLGRGDKQFKKDIAYYETKARAITLVLYYFADLENKIVMDTGNKTELSIGYYARYGEAGDIMPLANLYKTEVYRLGEYLEIPDIILNRHPAPDIIPGITDEAAIGMSYSQLDRVLLMMENGNSVSEIAEALQISEESVYSIEKVKNYARIVSQIPIKLDV